jgi:hypothetical protein
MNDKKTTLERFNALKPKVLRHERIAGMYLFEAAAELFPRTYYDDFIFGGGCVAVDARLAAIFWVLDNA